MLAVSYRPERSYKRSYHTIEQSYSLEFPKEAENLRPPKNLHMEVYSSFIYSCQNLEPTTHPSVGKRMNYVPSRQGRLFTAEKKGAIKTMKRRGRNLHVYD